MGLLLICMVSTDPVVPDQMRVVVEELGDKDCGFCVASRGTTLASSNVKRLLLLLLHGLPLIELLIRGLRSSQGLKCHLAWPHWTVNQLLGTCVLVYPD